MTGSLEMALQEALTAVLTPVLAALDPAVELFDQAPQAQAYPFAEFARVTFRTDADLTPDQQRATITFAVYDDSRGRRGVVAPMSAMRGALHNLRLPVTGGEAVNIMHEQSDAIVDSDGVTWVGTAIFTAWLAPD